MKILSNNSRLCLGNLKGGDVFKFVTNDKSYMVCHKQEDGNIKVINLKSGHIHSDVADAIVSRYPNATLHLGHKEVGG